MVDRIYAQYRDKPKAVAWYNIVPQLAGEISDAYESVRISYNIDLNVSEQLNVIGRIVGIDKPWSAISDDVIYRTLLRSKIAKNNNDATLDGIVSAMSFIIPSNSASLSDYENMTFDVVFNGTLTPTLINILDQFDIVPRPQGVRFRGYGVPLMSTIYGAEDAQYGAEDAQYGFYFGGTG